MAKTKSEFNDMFSAPFDPNAKKPKPVALSPTLTITSAYFQLDESARASLGFTSYVVLRKIEKGASGFAMFPAKKDDEGAIAIINKNYEPCKVRRPKIVEYMKSCLGTRLDAFKIKGTWSNDWNCLMFRKSKKEGHIVDISRKK